MTVMAPSTTLRWWPQRIDHPAVRDRVDEDQDGHEEEAGEEGWWEDHGRVGPIRRKDVGKVRAERRQYLLYSIIYNHKINRKIL